MDCPDNRLTTIHEIIEKYLVIKEIAVDIVDVDYIWGNLSDFTDEPFCCDL